MATVAASARKRERRWPVIPPNAFSIAFGLAGLASSWRAAQPTIGSAATVAHVMFLVAAVIWFALMVLYLGQGWRHLLSDLRDQVLGPFVPVAAIVGMMLGSALSTVAFAAGQVVVIISLAAAGLLGGWMFGQWIVGDLNNDSLHPGYFLPTVAAGGIASLSASQVHLHGAAEASIGVAAISWLLLSSTVLNRLFFRRPLPNQLKPTLAIEAAPAAVVGVAYFALAGGPPNLIAYALGGYTVFMLITQMRLVPMYLGMRFSIGFWAFTFSYAIVATQALEWISRTKVAGATGYAIAVLALVTTLVAAIAVRSVVAIARGQFLPRGPVTVLAQERRAPTAPTGLRRQVTQQDRPDE